MMRVMAEMPKYQCHKQVWALKIAEVRGSTLIPEDYERFAAIDVGYDWIEKHQPVAGGYYVVYADGYKSYSPAKAFEEGYTHI